jgi:hypothetical protein
MDAVTTASRRSQGNGAASFLALSPASTVVATAFDCGSAAASFADSVSSYSFSLVETAAQLPRRSNEQHAKPQFTTQAAERTAPQLRPRSTNGARSRALQPSLLAAGSSMAVGDVLPRTASANEAAHESYTSSDLLFRLQRVLSAARSKLAGETNDVAMLSAGSFEAANLDTTVGAAPGSTATLTAVPPSTVGSDGDVLAALAGGSFASAESSAPSGRSFKAGSWQPAADLQAYSPAAETLAATVARALRLPAQ